MVEAQEATRKAAEANLAAFQAWTRLWGVGPGESMPPVRGRLTEGAALAPLVWFKAGGMRAMAVRTAGRGRSVAFLAALDPAVPVMALGLGSNLIVRDGGVPGVVVRLGKAFAQGRAARRRPSAVAAGRAASSCRRPRAMRASAGVEFLRSIPGTVGGFVRMNGGAYGREVQDVLVEADVVLRSANA